jgi:hypothetical protein
MKYRIRFNKTRGQPGRGTAEHVWRVFDESGKEWICKNIQINVSSFGQKEEASEDWNIVAEGFISVDKYTSTVTINLQEPKQ